MTSFHVLTPCLLGILVIFGACETASAPGAESKGAAKAEADPGTSGETTPERFTGEGIVDLSQLLHRSPEQVEALLGPPTDTGKQRISCVRFVPERVFFACEQEGRFYAHPQLDRIMVEYEDGVSTVVSLVGLRGEGAFDPYKALTIAGLSLPGNPRESKPVFGLGDTPENQVQAWDWYNSQARMLVDGQQYRVQVSVVNGEWKRSKVEVVDNSPLTEDQKKRIKPSKSDPGVSEDPGLR